MLGCPSCSSAASPQGSHSRDSWHSSPCPEHRINETSSNKALPGRWQILEWEALGESHRAGGYTATEERDRKARGVEGDGVREAHTMSSKHPSRNITNHSCSVPGWKWMRQNTNTAECPCRATYPWAWFPSWGMSWAKPQLQDSTTSHKPETSQGKHFPAGFFQGSWTSFQPRHCLHLQWLQTTAQLRLTQGVPLCGNSFWSSLIPP